MTLRRAALVSTTCCLALTFSGCPDKKPEPPPEVKVATPVVEPPRPAETPEPRAEKECAAPIDLSPPVDVTIGTRAAKASGYKLTFSEKDADGTLTLGVLGPVNEDSGPNILTLRKYVKFFQQEKADAIVVTGDVGEVAAGIARALEELAASKLPVLVIAGNRECRAEYSDGVSAAQKEHSNIVNMNLVRAVEFPEATLVSLPGYHDQNFITCATGCRYHKSTVDEVVRVAKESKGPVVLVSHGPPHGDGSQALDYASAGGNVGNEQINQAIQEGNIAFGLFSNIKEAGARATSDAAGTTILKPATPSKTLYLNPGPADTVGWEMNDGTKSLGLAAVMSIQNGQASYKLFRAKALTAAEKAEAKKLEPPARPEGGEETMPAKGEAPSPPPGTPAGAPVPTP
ncbi:MAG: metallophosphoesterase family protein [Myxococcota bacterium]